MNAAFPTTSTRGSVLIVVLWACLGLVSLTLLFGHSMIMTYRGADNDLAGHQARQAIEGAARYVESLLANATTPGVFPDPTTYESEAVPVGEAFYWFIGRPDDGSANTLSGPSSTFGTVPSYGLIDEASKLNLNTATLEMLEALPGMTPELAASIIDWRDTDDDVTPGGAESNVYAAKRPAYLCKNGPLESIGELALVNGADYTLLYGEDANLNGLLDPNQHDGNASFPPDNADGKLDPGILEYVTVFSREPNTRSDGSARVSVASIQALSGLLQQTFGADRAQQLLQQAGPTPSKSPLEFYVRSGMTADEYGRIADALTASSAPYQTGLVNVNTASETVLACIPGIGPDKASTLVATRLSRAVDDSELANIAWVADALGQDGATQAGPYLTGRSFQVSADIAAVGRHGRGYRRERLVIDDSTGTPRIIYRRDLSPLGWALGAQARQTLATARNTP